MFVDNENQFSTQGTAGQSLSGFAVGTTALANVIDSSPLGGQNTPNTNAGRDFGMGYPAWLYLLFIAAPTSGGGATIDVQLVSSAAQALTSPNVMLDLTGGAQAYNGGKFAAGTQYRIAMPRAGIYNATLNPSGWLRYIGVNFIVATAALTGGTVNCFLTRDNQDNVLQAAGFAVS
jgi:hypothetical protein